MKSNKKYVKKRKLNLKKIYTLLLIVLIFAMCIPKNRHKIKDSIQNIPNILPASKSSEYPVIKKDTNKNYQGIGQQHVYNKDGYFTTFTTIDINQKTYIEYKQNGNSSWSQNDYWGGTMADNGCGITVLSIILSGYNKNYTPEDLRKKYSPVLNYSKLSKELRSVYGIGNSDFYYDSVHLSKSSIEKHLQSNRPIIVCIWNKPSSNRWTTTSHYMALLATDGNGMIYVSNPNGGANDSKSSGWYPIDEVLPYIAKALYINKY